MNTSRSNTQTEQSRRSISLPQPRMLALAFGVLVEIADTFLGRRQRRLLDALARHTAELYAADDARQAEKFRNRLDQRLRNRHLEVVDWQAGHGQ